MQLRALNTQYISATTNSFCTIKIHSADKESRTEKLTIASCTEQFFGCHLWFSQPFQPGFKCCAFLHLGCFEGTHIRNILHLLPIWTLSSLSWHIHHRKHYLVVYSEVVWQSSTCKVSAKFVINSDGLRKHCMDFEMYQHLSASGY